MTLSLKALPVRQLNHQIALNFRRFKLGLGERVEVLVPEQHLLDP